MQGLYGGCIRLFLLRTSRERLCLKDFSLSMVPFWGSMFVLGRVTEQGSKQQWY